MNTQSLPPDLESQLSELEKRHKRHQQKMEEQRDAPFVRREKHLARKFSRSIPPNTLI